MTEGEAKKKWCPFARVPSAVNGTIVTPQSGEIVALNRTDTGAPYVYCLGKDCMAWHWKNLPHYPHGGMLEPAYEQGDGYCGLAGKPEMIP